MSSTSKKVVLPRPSITQPSSSSSSQREFPALPIHPNRFGPIAPRARPPYSALVQNIPVSTQTINQTPSSKSPIPISPRSPFVSPTSPSIPSQNTTQEYHINPNKQIIKILEPFEEQKLSQSFLTLTDYLYPKGCHFYIDNYKTREYYQAILSESGSVIIDHTINKKSPDYIDCSKAKILKIITPEEWLIKPYNYKTLSSYPSYPVYNYYDYQDAWLYAFLLRSFSHTWFFYFSEKFNGIYPRWFIKWFRYYGNIPATLPAKVLEGYNIYKDYFMQDHITPAEYILQFSAIFKIPWILLFTYKKQEAQDTSPPLFYRQFSVKWWKKIDEKQADIKAVKEYYKKISTENPSTQVLEIQDEDFIRRIQSCSSKEDLQKIINEIKGSPTSSEELFQDSQDPYEDIILN